AGPIPAADGRSAPRVIVTGCWATSDKAEAERLPGVSAVLGHHDDVAEQLDRLLRQWQAADAVDAPVQAGPGPAAGTASAAIDSNPTRRPVPGPEKNVESAAAVDADGASGGMGALAAKPARVGTTALPLLEQRQTAHQRAFLKIQDGCDAHCTYCIIPQLR